jgi:hypothetical protein
MSMMSISLKQEVKTSFELEGMKGLEVQSCSPKQQQWAMKTKINKKIK